MSIESQGGFEPPKGEGAAKKFEKEIGKPENKGRIFLDKLMQKSPEVITNLFKGGALLATTYFGTMASLVDNPDAAIFLGTYAVLAGAGGLLANKKALEEFLKPRSIQKIGEESRQRNEEWQKNAKQMHEDLERSARQNAR